MKGSRLLLSARLLALIAVLIFSINSWAVDQSISAQIDYSTSNVQGVQVMQILEELQVSGSQLSALQTPIAIHDGNVYIANIEPGHNGDTDGIDLWTVLRKGSRVNEEHWEWSSSLVEERTVYDAWHTPPSVGVDSQGYVHVAYNMHNTPWQYARSINPGDINNLEFLGQWISREELHALKYENKTSFPGLGTAAIPGNQITYPRFVKDQTGKLYIGYRFASRPARQFSERTMSAGIASYDVETRSWHAIGAELALENWDWKYAEGSSNIAEPFGASIGWTASTPQLAFGRDNDIHVGMTWRQGLAGVQYSHPCVFRSYNATDFTTPSEIHQSLPITAQDCQNNGIGASDQFYNTGSMAVDGNGVIHYLAHSLSDGVVLFSRNPDEGYWKRERGLNGIRDLFVDRDGALWAVASGLRVLRRDKEHAVWRTVYHKDTNNDCFPRVSLDENKQFAYVHTQSCDQKTVSIYSIQLY